MSEQKPAMSTTQEDIGEEIVCMIVRITGAPEGERKEAVMAEAKRIEAAFEATIAKGLELNTPTSGRAVMLHWYECRAAGVAALKGESDVLGK